MWHSQRNCCLEITGCTFDNALLVNNDLDLKGNNSLPALMNHRSKQLDWKTISESLVSSGPGQSIRRIFFFAYSFWPVLLPVHADLQTSQRPSSPSLHCCYHSVWTFVTHVAPTKLAPASCTPQPPPAAAVRTFPARMRPCASLWPQVRGSNNAVWQD